MRPFALFAFLLGAALALPTAGCTQESPQDKAFGDKVRAYLLSHPEVIEEAVDKLQAKTEAQKQAVAKTAIADHRRALERDPRDFVAGNASGAVTVVEFFDYRCPYCKAAQPEIDQLLATHKDVRLVLKEFPILDIEDQTKISEDAARAALAAKSQGKYMPIHQALLGEKHLDEADIQRILKANAVDLTKAKAQAGASDVTTLLADNHALARAIGIDGTPAFVVGDRMIAGANMSELERAIQGVREANKRAAN